MGKINKIEKKSKNEKDIGFFLWQLEEMEHFYPLYKSMIKKKV